jgi:hypothetical protein
MSDTLIQGSVQVNSGIVSQTSVSLVVGDGACTVVLEPAPPPPTFAMRLQSNGTVISTDGKYSEDTTIQIAAVDASTGEAIQSFTGTVDLAEDGTSIYSQNGGAMPASVQISSGGTATFVVKSVAGPGVSGQSPPGAALIKSTNYPVYGGPSLPVPQWIISGTRIDSHSSGDVYDWFQARARDIFASATGNVQTVLSAVSYYTVGAIDSEGVTNWQRASQSPIEINPFYIEHRLGSAGSTECGFSYTDGFRDTLLHEARHAYQASQAALPGNDVDGDFLVNAISIAPTDIFLDTTTPRTVCNVDANTTVVLGYHGDGVVDQPGPPDNANYAWEQDARAFSSAN